MKECKSAISDLQFIFVSFESAIVFCGQPHINICIQGLPKEWAEYWQVDMYNLCKTSQLSLSALTKKGSIFPSSCKHAVQ